MRKWITAMLTLSCILAAFVVASAQEQGGVKNVFEEMVETFGISSCRTLATVPKSR